MLPIIYSIKEGEQGGYPFILNDVDDISGYTFEATVIECYNTGTGDKPTKVRPNGIQTKLDVFVSAHKGVWNESTYYQYRDVVNYNGTSYIKSLKEKAAIREGNPKDNPDVWTPHKHNVVYVRILRNIAEKWLVRPSYGSPVYGFISMTVTSPNRELTTLLQKVRVPMVGYIEINYEPNYEESTSTTPVIDNYSHFSIESEGGNLYTKYDGSILTRLKNSGDLSIYGNVLVGGHLEPSFNPTVRLGEFGDFTYEALNGTMYLKCKGDLLYTLDSKGNLTTKSSITQGAVIKPIEGAKKFIYGNFSIEGNKEYIVFSHLGTPIMSVSQSGDISVSGSFIGGSND